MNEYRIDGLTIRENIMRLSNNGNKKFTESLHPGVENVLGIRVPDLRVLAKKIAKDDWKTFLKSAPTDYMEERMLIGMVISNIKVDDVDEYLLIVDQFVKIINSWSVCDTFDFSGQTSFVKKNSEKVWKYLYNYMNSANEYEIRFGVVMPIKYYIDEAHITQYIEKLLSIKHEGYYVRMAIAWALSTCYIKFPEITYFYLANGVLDNGTLKKTIQKICDSFRVSDENKTKVKLLREQLK